MTTRISALALLVLMGLAACEQGRAPADWAARNRVATGDPQGGPPTTDPKNARATEDVRPGQEQFWTVLIAGLIMGSAIAVGAGTWYFEARRRSRRRVRDTAAETPRRRNAS